MKSKSKQNQTVSVRDCNVKQNKYNFVYKISYWIHAITLPYYGLRRYLFLNAILRRTESELDDDDKLCSGGHIVVFVLCIFFQYSCDAQMSQILYIYSNSSQTVNNNTDLIMVRLALNWIFVSTSVISGLNLHYS